MAKKRLVKSKVNRSTIAIPAKNIYEWCGIRTALLNQVQSLTESSLWVRHYKECSVADDEISEVLSRAEASIAMALNHIDEARELMNQK